MRHEAAFLRPPLVDMRHAEAMKLQDAANHDGSQHVVEIRHSIHAVTLQLPRQSPQSAQPHIVLPQIHGKEVHILG